MGYYSDVIIADGGANLLGYWTHDAEFGITDKAPVPHNGVAGGGVTIGGVAGPGELTATDFDGSNDRVTTTLNAFTNGTVRTFEWWANRDTNGTDDSILGGDVGGNPPPTLRLPTGTQNVQWRAQAGLSNVQWSNACPGNGVWWYGMLVFDEGGNTAALYVNGALVSSQAFTDAYNAVPGNLVIGDYKNGASEPFDGKLAHVAVYNGDFSAYRLSHYGWGLSTLASRNPLSGLPSAGAFPHSGFLPRGETLGATP